MELMLTLFTTWILLFVKDVQNDESLSFSAPIHRSTLPESSFWFGTMSSTLFGRDITIQVYLNEPRGLLFYAIDNLYQTLWLEFDNTQIIVNYYNFKMRTILSLTYERLCSQQPMIYTYLNITLSQLKDNWVITCNEHENNLFYVSSSGHVNNTTLSTFLDEMKLPVPFFQSNDSYSENKTYIWIGNSPASKTNGYRNKMVEAGPNNIVGCVKSFSISNFTLKLATTGIKQGALIKPFCKPVCDSNSCNNHGQCIELWQQRFRCECYLSRFIGELCNETHGVDFDGERFVNISLGYKLQKFQIAFNYENFIGQYETKVFSIKFELDQHMHVYIDKKRRLQVMIIRDKSVIIDKTFKSQLKYTITFILIIDVDINTMTFKLFNSQNQSIIEQQIISHSFPNLITTAILVGDSHADRLKWMKRFDGCISNLLLISGKKKFIWNSIPDFDKLPKCDKKRYSPYLQQERIPETMELSADSSPSLVNSDKNIKTGNTAIIVIVIVIILIVAIIGAVLAYTYRSKIGQCRKEKVNNKSFRKPNQKKISKGTVPINSSVPYKAAYTAGSMSKSPDGSRSVPLVHISTHIPEDEEDDTINADV